MPTQERSEQQVDRIVEELKRKLLEGKKRKLVFLLVGRTGVGKSSTVNSLMGETVAKVSAWEPATMEVQSYDCLIHDMQFKVIDTPGLCDDLEEKGNDLQYLNTIRSQVKKVDCMLFVTRLDDTRVTSDEKRGIKLISEAFGERAWEHSVIVFTFSNAPNITREDFPVALDKRTQLIQQEIAKHTNKKVAAEVPSVAVDNTSETTPDGEPWLGELYTQVFVRVSPQGTIPLLLATASRVDTGGSGPKKNTRSRTARRSTSARTSAQARPTPSRAIILNESQQTAIQKKINATVIPKTAALGAMIAAPLGPVAAAIGGAVGAGMGMIAWFIKK
jgi:GTPase SAR1 family protein